MEMNDIYSICDEPLNDAVDNSLSELTQDAKWNIWKDKSWINVHSKCKGSNLVQSSALKSTETSSSQTIEEPSSVANELLVPDNRDSPSLESPASSNTGVFSTLFEEGQVEYQGLCVFCESK